MKTESLLQRYNQTLNERNRLLLGLSIAGGLSVVLGLSVFYLVGRERIVVVPPIVAQEFWVATDSVSDSYLEQMATFFAGLLLNVTPNSFARRSEHLLQHVAPHDYPALKAQLVEQQLEIERRVLSTSFHPSSFKIDRRKLLVELKGELKLMVGNAPVQLQSKTYQIQFVQTQGRLYIQRFDEVANV
jgi:conjugal transfer pilus assembly protein TraE